MRLDIKSKIILLIIVVISSYILIGDAAAFQIDTTRVREKPEKKSPDVSKVLLKTPEYVVKTPVWVLEGIADFSLNEIVLTDFTEDVIRRLTAVDRVWGFFPLISYGSNSGIRYGLTFTSEKVITRGERLRIKAYHSTHKYRRVSIEYSAPDDITLPFFRRLMLEAHYRKRPWESFYGIGNATREDDEVNFNLEDSYLKFGWFHPLHPTTRIEVSGAYKYCNIYDGEDPDLVGDLDSIRAIFDLNDNQMVDARVWSIGLTLNHDWRDHSGQPSKGGWEALSVEYNKGISRTDDLEYLVFRGDLRHYLNIYKKRIITLRLLLETTEFLGTSLELPFYLRSSLGGREQLRGFRTNRFVDHNFALATIEWRFPVWDVVDGFVYFEEGRVFNTFTEDFKLANWNYSTGAGIRIWGHEGLMLRTFFGVSRDGFRGYAELSEDL